MKTIIIKLAQFVLYYFIKFYCCIKGGKFTSINYRKGTTDLYTFWMIFIKNEYRLPNKINIKPNLIIDAGANIGLASLYYHFNYPEAKILSVEFETSNLKLLNENTINFTNISIIDKAIWYENSLLAIKNPVDDRKKDSFYVSNYASEDDIRIYTVTPRELLANKKKGDIVLFKIDIEGAELELFSNNVIEWINEIDFFVIETHDRFKENCKSKIIEVLNKFEFEILQVEGYHLMAKCKSK